MEFIGSIQAPGDPPGIDKSRWHHVIQSHPNLALNEPKEGLNPFTQERELFEPNPDVARVIINSPRNRHDALESVRGANEVHVFGGKDEVSPIAHEVAQSLRARYDPDALQARQPSRSSARAGREDCANLR